MAVNQVIYDGNVLIDLTEDTTSAENVVEGVIFHLPNGQKGVGTAPTISRVLEIFYPIGSYYETSDGTFDPNITWGGTWELESGGLVHIGADTNYTIGDTGGEATHTLTSAESGVPVHGHEFTNPTYTASGVTVGKHAKTACGRTTDVALTNNHSASVSKQPTFNGPAHTHGAIRGVAGKLGSGTLGARMYPISDDTGTKWLTDSSGTGACSRTQDVAISVSAHAITQPAFQTPELTHTVTQPTISKSTDGSVSNNTATDATNAHNNMQPYKVVNRWHRIA